MGRLGFKTALLLWGVICFAVPALADDHGTHRILIVYETDSRQPAVVEIARGIHHGLDDSNPTVFEVYSEYLDSNRFPGADNLARMASMLAAKYTGVTFDAAVAVGPTSLRFLLDNRNRIAPHAPLLFGAVRASSPVIGSLPPDVKGVVSRFDVRRTVELARQLQPKATEAVVITGSAPFDRNWEASARESIGDHYLGFDIRYLTDLSLQGFADAVRRLPRDSVVLVLSIYQDAEGLKFVPREALARIGPVSAAPVYSVYDTYFDKGILGGYMGTFEDTGQQLAALISRVIAGEANVPAVTQLVTRPIVDWRLINRYGIDPARLPPDTEIRYRIPSLWEDYRQQILGIAAVVLLQAGLIAALIVQGQRRKTVEKELAAGRLELAHLSRTSMLGELSGAFAHELNQPLTAILANAEAGRRMLDRDEPDTAELKEILTEIADDDRRAAGVITQLRRLLVKGEAVLEPVDLNQVVTATLALARSELLVRRTMVDFLPAQVDATVLGNFAQLQQVVLNLIINAAEATSGLPPAARIISVAVRRKNGASCELEVSDNGPGLTPDMQESVFKPFVSTKANGLGLGLAICRSIASAHNGTLRFDGSRLAGASIVLTLPAQEGRDGREPLPGASDR